MALTSLYFRHSAVSPEHLLFVHVMCMRKGNIKLEKDEKVNMP